MNITKRQPVSVGEMITEEFLMPVALTQGQLAEAMGVVVMQGYREQAIWPLRDLLSIGRLTAPILFLFAAFHVLG